MVGFGFLFLFAAFLNPVMGGGWVRRPVQTIWDPVGMFSGVRPLLLHSTVKSQNPFFSNPPPTTLAPSVSSSVKNCNPVCLQTPSGGVAEMSFQFVEYDKKNTYFCQINQKVKSENPVLNIPIGVQQNSNHSDG